MKYLFNLDQFGQVLTNLNTFRLFWSILVQFEQVSTYMIKFRPIWTISDKFKFAWIFRFWRSILWGISSWNGVRKRGWEVSMHPLWKYSVPNVSCKNSCYPETCSSWIFQMQDLPSCSQTSNVFISTPK